MKKLYYGLLAAIALFLPGACTDLMEEPYDQIVVDNFYQKKEDIIRSLVRSFEHGFWSAASDPYVLQELTADQFVVLQRGRHWYDDGVYFQLHHHEWTFEHWLFNNTWNALFNGVALANNSLEDLQALDYTKFGLTATDQEYHVAELRTLRAWYYLRAFDIFRNIPLATTLKTSERYLPQSAPQETFDFIEKELLESVNGLPEKGDKANLDGMFTKAAAMTALARLYLNAEVYTGQPMYKECAKICQDIIDGVYGDYSLDDEWRGPFDYDNHLSPEMIFAFPSTKNRSPHHFNLLWWSFPNTINDYFQYFDQGLSNPRFCLNPSLDPAGNEYPHVLGKPFEKFKHYPEDLRLKLYSNLGSSEAEGMFLFGQLTNPATGELINGVEESNGEPLNLVDQVARFSDLGPGQDPASLPSDISLGEENSGIRVAKYPWYPSDDDNNRESDCVEMRLSEIYYMLAECRLREGDIPEAGRLLNAVRKRNFPASAWAASLYQPEGSAVLNEQELLDEWGREFLGEGRRRTDLVRFGVFTSGEWWDKQPSEEYRNICPIPRDALNVNGLLKQNPGY